MINGTIRISGMYVGNVIIAGDDVRGGVGGELRESILGLQTRQHYRNGPQRQDQEFRKTP